MATSKSLGVWLDGTRIADLTDVGWPRIRLKYTKEALGLWPRNSPVISCALPLSPRALDARTFCKGLLPEGRALQTLASQAGLATNDTFNLLRRYGRDVAGALVISEDAPEPRRYGAIPYSTGELESAIDDLDEHPLGSHDDSELSLAGLQDKLLLVDLGGGRWGRPVRGQPATHILKADDRRFPGLVQAESYCLALARDLGLTTVETTMLEFDGLDCLIVSRFDRETTNGVVRRIHQEDACQALDLDHELRQGRGKYESGGGPSLRQVAGILDTWSDDPQRELDRLLAAATFTVAIGNADAHGKNLALLHPTPERIRLAPLYDTVPTALWAKLRTAAAMVIGGRLDLPSVTVADLRKEALSWNHPGDRADQVIRDTIEILRDSLQRRVIPNDTKVWEFVERRTAELLAG